MQSFPPSVQITKVGSDYLIRALAPATMSTHALLDRTFRKSSPRTKATANSKSNQHQINTTSRVRPSGPMHADSQVLQNLHRPHPPRTLLSPQRDMRKQHVRANTKTSLTYTPYHGATNVQSKVSSFICPRHVARRTAPDHTLPRDNRPARSLDEPCKQEAKLAPLPSSKRVFVAFTGEENKCCIDLQHHVNWTWNVRVARSSHTPRKTCVGWDNVLNTTVS